MGMPAADTLPIRLGLTTIDLADGHPKPHVDYSLEVRNTEGLVMYAGGPFHEHEGAFEVVLGPWPAGQYTLDVTAQPTMDTPEELHFPSIQRSFEFDVMEFVVDGQVDLQIEVAEHVRAGESATLTFSIIDRDGVPVMHTDNLVLITKDDTVLYQATNTHIHVPPFELTYVFTEPGEYTIWFTSAPTPMRASVDFPITGSQLVLDVQ